MVESSRNTSAENGCTDGGGNNRHYGNHITSRLVCSDKLVPVGGFTVAANEHRRVAGSGIDI